MRYFIAMCLLLITNTSFAEYIPGKERKVAEASMKVVRASGIYQDIREANVRKYSEDGKGFVRLELSSENLQISLPVGRIQSTLCGDFAWSQELVTEGYKTKAVLADYSHIQCRMRLNEMWNLQIQTMDANGIVSTLELEGTPRLFFQTM